MDRDQVNEAISILSRSLYRATDAQREEIRDQLANLIRIADQYLKPEQAEGLTARHVQSSR